MHGALELQPWPQDRSLDVAIFVGPNEEFVGPNLEKKVTQHTKEERYQYLWVRILNLWVRIFTKEFETLQTGNTGTQPKYICLMQAGTKSSRNQGPRGDIFCMVSFFIYEVILFTSHRGMLRWVTLGSLNRIGGCMM